MKPQELRIGNWYQSVRWKKPVQLELSDLAELDHRCDGVELDSEIISEMFEPLPLTEEWLIKFGFQNYGDMTIGNAYISLSINSDGFYFILTKLEYVHQLQNLYFALTGKELTIK